MHVSTDGEHDVTCMVPDEHAKLLHVQLLIDPSVRTFAQQYVYVLVQLVAVPIPSVAQVQLLPVSEHTAGEHWHSESSCEG